jgi:hypothetical protein
MPLCAMVLSCLAIAHLLVICTRDMNHARSHKISTYSVASKMIEAAERYGPLPLVCKLKLREHCLGFPLQIRVIPPSIRSCFQ